MRRSGTAALPRWFGLMALAMTAVTAEASIQGGRVLDAQTGKPVGGALVTINGTVRQADANGRFALANPAQRIAIRAPGYGRTESTDAGTVPRQVEIRLPAIEPKALYLSFYGIGDRGLRGAALKLIEETELNALVIDVKGDRGSIPYRSSVPLAAEIGAQKPITVRDMPALMASMRQQGVYTIARIVTFKDDLLARAKPELAIRRGDGQVWVDREGLAWLDPFRKDAWGYIIDVAAEAARLGFDEVQFDYIRFPDTRGLVFSQPNTEENRVAAISGFLAEARRRLAPHNVFVSADIFGYVLWNTNDTEIGQRLEDIAPHVDYIAPMLYPSGFQFGIPGIRNPVSDPHGIIAQTLKNAQKRTGLPAVRFRPWLQAFRDYAFDRRLFGPQEISEQTRAAATAGSNGFMLWNPRNAYTQAGLKLENTPQKQARAPTGLDGKIARPM